MPPLVALLLCLPVIIWALRAEVRTGQALSGRIWLPFIWLLILGSRPLSFWVGVQSGGGGGVEGNAFDRNLYLGLTLTAIYQLNRRQIIWGNILRDNSWMVLMYFYLLLTCMWSEFPFVTFKRWFKDLAAIPVLLIFFTFPNVNRATKSIFTKCAIIWFILSVVFIKYFPDLGRIYSRSGGLQVTGITDQKNTLGEIVLISVLVIIWGASNRDQRLPKANRLRENLPVWLALSTGIWLLWMCDSKTSMICLAFGIFVLLGNRLPLLRNSPKVFLTICLLVVPLGYVLDQMLGLSAVFLEFIGRDATFTGRTGIWGVVKDHPVDPVFGCGYLMYWDVLGEVMIGKYPVTLKTAHNGYLDLYLDGGWVAVVLFIPALIFLGRKLTKNYLEETGFGNLGLAIFLVFIMANLSESTIFRRGPLWFTFLLCCLDYKRAFPVHGSIRQRVIS